MQKSIIFGFLLLSISFAQYHYAGRTGRHPVIYYPTGTPSSCSASFTQTNYEVVTIDTSLDVGVTFYYITLMVESSIQSHSGVAVYNGNFSPVDSCQNVTAFFTSSSGAPHAAVLVELTPGIHDIVIYNRDSSSYSGSFVVHADKADWYGSTSEASPSMWIPTTSTSCSVSSFTSASYTYYQWTAATTETIDILAFVHNDSISYPSIWAVLYNTATIPSLGSGNSSYPADLCTGVTANWVASAQVGGKASQLGYGTATLYEVSVSAGSTYTLVLSGSTNLQYFNWGVWKRPTVARALGSSGSFDRPGSGDSYYGDICYVYYYNLYYAAIPIVEQNPTYIIDTEYRSGGLDTFGCLYTGSSAQAIADPCGPTWVACADTENGYSLSEVLSNGQSLTYIATSYSSFSSPGEKFYIYIYTGVQIGPTPNTTIVTGSSSGYSTGYGATTADDWGFWSSDVVGGALRLGIGVIVGIVVGVVVFFVICIVLIVACTAGCGAAAAVGASGRRRKQKVQVVTTEMVVQQPGYPAQPYPAQPYPAQPYPAQPYPQQPQPYPSNGAYPPTYYPQQTAPAPPPV